MKRLITLIFLALIAISSPAIAAQSILSCLLYTGGNGIALKQSADGELSAKSKGVAITISSMGGNSFETFQATLSVPKLSDIRAYGTKSGLAPLFGNVVGYLNNSRSDEISVTCEVNK
jgi:hypothetical protein